MTRVSCSVCLVVLAVASVSAAVDFDIPEYETPDDNAFDCYLVAFGAFPAGRPWDGTYDQLDSVSVGDAEAIVLGAQECLGLLRLGLGKLCIMPPVEDMNTPLPYLRDFRSMARLLALEGWVYARQGDFASAFKSNLDGLLLGQDIARNGSLIHKLVSIACEAIACHQVRRTVGLGPDAPALAAIVAMWPPFEEREVPLAESLAVEYRTTRRVLERSRQDPNVLAPPVALTPEMVDKTLADLDVLYSKIVAAAKLEYWRLPPGAGEVKTDNVVLAEALSGLMRSIEKSAAHQANLRGTLLVAALGLYFARHGDYPETLAGLVPDTLKQLPVDPFSGDGFRYVLDDPLTYRLYSLGPNMRDDAGVEPENRAGDDGDLVFSTRG